jgi:cold shock CspA family protein
MIEGVVEGFDARAGYGYLRADDGARYFFHCVDIADGSREIGQGVRARGERAAGHLGRDELRRVSALG